MIYDTELHRKLTVVVIVVAETWPGCVSFIFYGCIVIPFSTDSYVESFLIHSQHADADAVARNTRNVGGDFCKTAFSRTETFALENMNA